MLYLTFVRCLCPTSGTNQIVLIADSYRSVNSDFNSNAARTQLSKFYNLNHKISWSSLLNIMSFISYYYQF